MASDASNGRDPSFPNCPFFGPDVEADPQPKRITVHVGPRRLSMQLNDATCEDGVIRRYQLACIWVRDEALSRSTCEMSARYRSVSRATVELSRANGACCRQVNRRSPRSRAPSLRDRRTTLGQLLAGASFRCEGRSHPKRAH